METFEKFTWTINNFSKLDSEMLYSENFIIDDHTWRILIFPRGNYVNWLSVFLDGGALANNLPSGWVKLAKFNLAVVNQVNVEMTSIKDARHNFSANEIDWGFGEFMPLYELYDISNGFLVNDTCVIEAGIWARNSKQVNKVQANKNNDSTVPAEVVGDESNEVVDFRGLGKIEKAFVPMLEDVCSRYPSLVDCHKKRSYKFTEWAFTALGRVLHFLNTKKVKDMKDDEACDHLQILWDELETCRFDLTWLKPHIQSALSYKDRAEELKKLKKNVTALKSEAKTQRSRLIATEEDLEIAKRELLKAEQGFEEKDSDAELGYGGSYIDFI